MTINQRDRGFQATVHRKGRRWRRQFDTYDQAEQWEAQAKADILACREPDMGERRASPTDMPTTLGELLEYTNTHEWADRKSGAGLYKTGKLVVAMLGINKDARSITGFDIDNLVIRMKDMGNSNGTINRKLAALSKVLTTAKHLGVIASKPRIKRVREGVNRIRWFTDDELQQMIQFCIHAGSPDFACWIRFQADTGLRCGETQGLRWEDIQGDFVVLSDTKSDTPRGVPLTEAAKTAIQAMRHRKDGPFTWATDGYRRKWWNRVRIHMDWLEDKQAVMHALRHTFCSRLVQRGVQILTVKELAGHKRIEMTLRYAHLAPHNLVSAVSVLEPNRQNHLQLT
tara:strand:+ start:262 stop:1287 length:1026 start_codon:yes stop_codon:yes gene_type:complete